jgi:hypothetical protein
MDKLLQRGTAIASLAATIIAFGALVYSAGYFRVIGIAYLRFFQVQDLVLLLIPALLSFSIAIGFGLFQRITDKVIGVNNAIKVPSDDRNWVRRRQTWFNLLIAATLLAFFFTPRVIGFIVLVPLFFIFTIGRSIIYWHIFNDKLSQEFHVYFIATIASAALLFAGEATAGYDIRQAWTTPAKLHWRNKEIVGRTLLLSTYGALFYETTSRRVMFYNNAGELLQSDEPNIEEDAISNLFGWHLVHTYLQMPVPQPVVPPREKVVVPKQAKPKATN